MGRIKTCVLCKRFYAGDGYEGVCTYDCHVKGLYAVKHNKYLPYEKIYKKKNRSEDPIEKGNNNWKQVKKQTDQKKYIQGNSLEKKRLRDDLWDGKNYNAVRG